MWDNINLIINKKRPSGTIDKIKVDSKCYQHPSSISNAFNKYFRDIPKNLASKVPRVNSHFSSFVSRKRSKFRFTQISELEVFLLLENLDGKKSFGIDTIHPRLLSISTLEIFRPLTFLLNLSITKGIFPNDLKFA